MSNGQESCKKWFQERTNLEKTLLSISVVLFLTFIFVIIGITKSSSSDESQEISVCSSKECVKTAGILISKADFSLNPCGDFYKYACGCYVKTTATHIENAEVSVRQTAADTVVIHLKNWLESTLRHRNVSVYRKARILYNTCLKYDVPLKVFPSILKNISYFEKVGTWPALNAFWDEAEFSLEQSLASLILLGVPVVFQLQIVPDKRNAKKYIPRLTPAKISLLSHDSSQIQDDQMFQSFVESTLLLLGVPRDKAIKEAQDILNVEAFIVKIERDLQKTSMKCSDPEEEKEIDESLNDFYTVRVLSKELNRIMPEMNWTLFMTHIYNMLNISINSEIELHCRHYIRDFTGYLKQPSQRSVQNFLGWRFLFAFMTHLGPPFHRLYSDFQAYINEGKFGNLHRPRWKECVSLVEHYMLSVLTAIYVEREDVKAAWQESSKIASVIKTKFEEILMSLEWLKTKEKQRIKQKMHNIEIIANKPALNIENIDLYFSELKLHSDHLIYNIMRLQRFIMAQQIKKLLLSEDNSADKLLATSSVSRFAIYDGDIIGISYSKLVEPYIRLMQPRYLNYGAYGTYVGRQLVYNIGKMRFKHANHDAVFWDIISNKLNISNCLSHQTFKLKYNDSISRNFINELIADQSSIYISHSAYLQNSRKDDILPGLELNNEQMYFLSFAQSQCEVQNNNEYENFADNMGISSHIRVNSALKNLPKFSEAYNCDVGTSMNPIHKCLLWQ